MYSSPEAIGPFNNRAWPRRFGAILGGGGLAIAGAVAVDGWLSRQHWTPTENRFTGLDPAAKEQSLSMGGLGVTCGESLAEDAKKFLPGPAGYATYSNGGFSLDHIAEIFGRKVAGINLLHLYLHSMSGSVGLELARRSKVKNMKLGQVVLNCSPFANNDAYLGRYTSLLEAVRWPVGPGSKLLFSFTRSMLEHRPVHTAWEQAKYDAVNGCSPHLFLSQLSILRRINLLANQEEYKPLIGHETKVLYCRPKNPQNDTVVNTLQASERFARFFAKLGVPYEDVPIPNVGHAESGPTADFLASRTR